MSATYLLTPEEQNTLERAQLAVSKMDSSWLLDFADQSATGMEMGIDDFRRLAQIESMTEIKGGLLSLMAAVWEICNRWEAEQR